MELDGRIIIGIISFIWIVGVTCMVIDTFFTKQPAPKLKPQYNKTNVKSDLDLDMDFTLSDPSTLIDSNGSFNNDAQFVFDENNSLIS